MDLFDPTNAQTIQDTAKAATPVIAPFLSSFFKARLEPVLTKFFGEKERQDNLKQAQEKFERYFKNALNERTKIYSVVFHGHPKELTQLYVPLSIRMEVANIDAPGHTYIDRYVHELLPQGARVLIRDTAGMGKSTISKFLFLECIKAKAGIPILVELRKLRKDKPIIEVIRAELDSINEPFDYQTLLDLIALGDFVFFLDGYDEVPYEDREVVVEDIQDFIRKAGNNRFLLTSREEATLGSFVNFDQYSIDSLTTDESFTLIRKIGSLATNDKAEGLIAFLAGDILERVRTFLANPLLTSYLYMTYDQKAEVPLKLPSFYFRVYDALYNAHDLSKTPPLVRKKRSNLDFDDFYRMLRSLALVTWSSGVEYEPDDLLRHIIAAKEHTGLEGFSPSEFLNDLVTAVPIFVKEGNGQSYRWAHRSLQDYFTAAYLHHDTGPDIESVLSNMTKASDYHASFETLRIYSVMNPKIARRYFRKIAIPRLPRQIVVQPDVGIAAENRSKSALLMLGLMGLAGHDTFDLYDVPPIETWTHNDSVDFFLNLEKVAQIILEIEDEHASSLMAMMSVKSWSS